MSTNSTQINDRICFNCGKWDDCNSSRKDDIGGYCVEWKPTEIDINNNYDYNREENLVINK